MNGADSLCDTLLANDVNVCFANPGTSEMHFVAALDRKPQMRCVLGLFEGVVTGAADGYARMADKPAATLLHCGPGLANALANLHNARRARTPMVNIVGDHASYHLVHDAPLTSDIESLAWPMSHWVKRTLTPGGLAADAAEACHAAMALPGVATLILPADTAWGEVDPQAQPVRADPVRQPFVDPQAIRAAAQALRSGRRTRLLLGGRALRADALAVAGRIAAATGARLLAPMMNGRIERGAGRVPIERVPYPIDPSLAALADIQCLVTVGASVPVAFFAYPGKPGRLIPDDAEVVAMGEPGDDLMAALEALADELGAKAEPVFAPLNAAESVADGPLTVDNLNAVLAQSIPNNAIVCDETISSGRQFFAATQGAPQHDYLQLTGGAIGIGLPLAAGAAIACPDRKVLLLQADGSGMYTCQALWTQAREGLDVVTVIFSNRAYAILQGEMRNVGVNHFGDNARRMLDLDKPALDWVSLARGMGVEAARAETVAGFTALLRSALSAKGPFLIEAVL
ncbi:acetolactate synthase large subunit [Aurantimonas aggregata]|uniref:Acetolactate synthase large subunit n=1 Tax=Aurantimonas aggregata TaxID=2047720 RepID=A0A6L9MN82_9HYPH|nr:acetolactate synthase large subunit [Aurantimonas aggregata]NDV89162.1 acetolactate synthase large subunit [Aurantimonas aggregata]